MTRKRARLVHGFVAALVVVGVACGSDDDSAGPEDTGVPDGTDGTVAGAESGAAAGSITIAIGTEPPNLDPQLRNDGGERAVNDNIYEALLAREPDGTLVPHLTTELPRLVDEDTWEVTLKDGITFHNGETLDADAVVASFERLVNPETQSELGNFWESFTGFEAVDERTVQFHTDGPDPTVPGKLYFLKVVPPEQSASTAVIETPIGTGPYRFVEWARGQEVVLEANPDYWGDPKPTIERVSIRFIPEVATRLAGLLAGDIDVMTNLPPDSAEEAPNAVSVTGLEHPYIIPSTVNGETMDTRVRQALSYAIDREALARDLFNGYATVDNCQTFSPSVVGYSDDLEPYPYDPERARQLLEEAGVEGATIELTSQSGRWLKDRELTEAIAAYWTDVGLNVDVQFYEFSEFLERLWADVRPETILTYGSTETFDVNNALAYNHAPSGQASSNDNEEFERLVAEGRQETDPEARQAIYDEILRTACEDAYIIHLLNIADVYGISDRVTWEPRIDGKLIVNEMRVTE